MKFEVSERINTSRSYDEVLSFVILQLKKVSLDVRKIDSSIEVNSIEATFGSINRSDKTVISLRKAENGWLVVADVRYRPSFAFWIILIITLFTAFFWLLPIAFYLYQKNTVRTAINDAFLRVKNEFEQEIFMVKQTSKSMLDQLEQLGGLREKGVITKEEFEMKKSQLLGN